jgi:hypothetical protein
MNRLNPFRPHAEEHPKGASRSICHIISVSPFEAARSAPPQGKGRAQIMKSFLSDVPFKGSRGVYLVIKLAVLVLAVLLALHFLFHVV